MDRFDVMTLIGLVMMGAGLYMVSLAYALAGVGLAFIVLGILGAWMKAV